VRDPSGAPVPSACPLPPAGRGALAVLRRRPWPPASTANPAAEGPVGWSSAPALLLRREALDSVDGFDSRYPGQLDDLDLADRLARAGWLTVHVPAAVVCCPEVGVRPDPSAARRYLADRSPRPVRALLRARS
jgi:N-acetylglucosaminyl-diphospho-decaprenol L-rhamnosyltransferase